MPGWWRRLGTFIAIACHGCERTVCFAINGSLIWPANAKCFDVSEVFSFRHELTCTGSSTWSPALSRNVNCVHVWFAGLSLCRIVAALTSRCEICWKLQKLVNTTHNCMNLRIFSSKVPQIQGFNRRFVSSSRVRSWLFTKLENSPDWLIVRLANKIPEQYLFGVSLSAYKSVFDTTHDVPQSGRILSIYQCMHCTNMSLKGGNMNEEKPHGSKIKATFQWTHKLRKTKTGCCE